MKTFFSALTLAAVVTLPAAAVAPVADAQVDRVDASPAADDKATKDDYAVDTSGTAAKIKVNADGTFSLKITPKNGKKVHPEAPLEVSVVEHRAIYVV